MALKLSQLNEDQYTITSKPKEKKGGLLQVGKNLLGGFLEEISTIPRTITQKQLDVLGQKAEEDSRYGRFAASQIEKAGNAPFSPLKTEEERLGSVGAEAGTLSTGIGKFAGLATQYLAPTSQVTKGQQILGTAASKLSTTGGLQLAGKGAARFVPEALGTGAVSLARTGGDFEQAKDEALLAGGFSVGLGALGGIARSTYWPTLDDSVSKALGVQGKKSGGVALQQTAQKVSGLKVLKDNADSLKVTLDDGSKAVFDPNNASYNTTLQAWNQARKKIYNEYTSLAQKAGERATVDLTTVREGLSKTLTEPRLSTYKTAAQTLLNDLDTNFDDLSKVDITRAEQFLQDLNSQTGNAFFKGTSDAASAEINAGTARTIREALDDVITENTGGNYQALRSQYAALKSIEDDLVRKFQQDARQIGGGLAEYTGAFASGDIIGGLLSANPAQLAKGGTLGVFAALKRKLSNPERFLRRSFDLIDEVPSDLSVRIFGGTKSINDIKNPQPNIGLSIKPSITPEKVAANIDAEDFVNISKYMEDPQAALLDDAIMKTIDEIGIGNADEATQMRFLREVTDIADESGKLKSFNQGATPNLADDIAKAKAEGNTLENLVSGDKLLQNNGSEMEFVGKMNTPKGTMYAFKTKGQPEGSFELFPESEIDDLLKKQTEFNQESIKQTKAEELRTNEEIKAKEEVQKRKQEQVAKETFVNDFLATLDTGERLNASKALKRLVQKDGRIIKEYEAIDEYIESGLNNITELRQTRGQKKGQLVKVLESKDGRLYSLDNRGAQTYAEHVLKTRSQLKAEWDKVK